VFNLALSKRQIFFLISREPYTEQNKKKLLSLKANQFTIKRLNIKDKKNMRVKIKIKITEEKYKEKVWRSFTVYRNNETTSNVF